MNMVIRLRIYIEIRKFLVFFFIESDCLMIIFRGWWIKEYVE